MTVIGTWDAAVVIAKAAAYAATLGAAGGVLFLAYSHSLIETSRGHRIRRLIGTQLLVAAFTSIARIPAMAASMGGDAAGLLDLHLARMILETGEGGASLVRMIGLALMSGALAARPPPPLALIGALAAATSFAWVGHVHALGTPWPPLLLGVHLLGIAFWVGALGPLLTLADGDVARAAAAAARFGAAALWVVAALLAAGVALLCLLLRSPAELWAASYGRLVLTKITLVACVLALAALNRRRLTPRLLANDSGALPALRASIRAEIALAGIVFLVTAAITTLAGPPRLE